MRYAADLGDTQQMCIRGGRGVSLIFLGQNIAEVISLGPHKLKLWQ